MPDLMMLVTCEDENSFGDWSLRYMARPVIVDTDVTGRWDVRFPGSYGDHSALEYFTVDAFRDTSGDPHMYSPHAGYRDVYRVHLAAAEAMVKVLRKVDRKVSELSERYGYPKDAAAYSAFVAEALGIKAAKPFIRKVAADRDFSGTGYHIMSADSLSSWLTDQERAWEKKHGVASRD